MGINEGPVSVVIDEGFLEVEFSEGLSGGFIVLPGVPGMIKGTSFSSGSVGLRIDED